MVFLLMLFVNLVALSCDVPLGCDFCHIPFVFFNVMFLLFLMVVQWHQAMMLLLLMLPSSPVLLNCNVPLVFVFI